MRVLEFFLPPALIAKAPSMLVSGYDVLPSLTSWGLGRNFLFFEAFFMEVGCFSILSFPPPNPCGHSVWMVLSDPSSLVEVYLVFSFFFG